jgi:urease subunit gamma/beta
VDLTPTERERLDLFVAAQLARETRSRGLPLNAPEAVALVCDELHLAARAGLAYDDVVDAGRRIAAGLEVFQGIETLVPEIRVEVLLDEGTRLIVLREPFGTAQEDGPGAFRLADADVPLVPDRERRTLVVRNAGTRPIRVSSHYPFWRVNASLAFDREAARGFRLDVPAGDHVRWGPGEEREVSLVAFGGQGGAEAGASASPGDEPSTGGDPR